MQPILKEYSKCECGCGELRLTKDNRGRLRKFIDGHQRRNTTFKHSDEAKEKIRNKMKGRVPVKALQANLVRMSKIKKYISHLGYVMIRDSGKWRPEHIVKMERKLGRKLGPKEVIHHKDHNRQNNKIRNLQVFPNSGIHLRDGHAI